MLTDNIDYPNYEEWIKIENQSPYKNLSLELPIRPKVDFDSLFFWEEFAFWVKQLNYKLAHIRISYVLLIHYFNKGIPDDELIFFDENEDEEKVNLKYFPDFQERHYSYKIMFDFYTDAFYNKFFSAWDSIFHVINFFYELEVEKSPRFSQKVMSKLKVENIELHNFLEKVSKDDSFIKAKILRNDITHNFPPNSLDTWFKRKKEENLISILIGNFNYVNSKDFLKNINEILILLSQVINRLKNEIIKDYQNRPRNY